MKLLKGIIVGGIVYSVYRVGKYAFNLKRIQNQASVSVSMLKPKLNWLNVQLFFEYLIKNPTEGSIEMAIPLIKLFYKGSELTASELTPIETGSQSSVSNGRISINAQGQTEPIRAEIKLPYTSLPGLVYDLATALQKRLNGDTAKVKLDIEVITTIYAGSLNIPYNDRQTIEI